MKGRLNILISTFAVLIFYSCQDKQDLGVVNKEPVFGDKELYDVTFSASGFTQHISPIDSKMSNVSNYAVGPKAAVDKLVFGIYDKSDVLIKTINQNSSDTDFGKATVQLIKGNYSIVALGARKEVTITLSETGSRLVRMLTPFNVNPKFGKEVGEFREQFAIQNQFEINKDSIYKPLELKYAIGRLELELLEQVPSEVAYILVGLNHFSNNYPFRVDQVGGISSSILYQVYETAKLGSTTNPVLKSNVNFYNSKETNYVVDILLYDKNYVMLGSKSISSAKFKPNYVTLISGKLFEDIFEKKNSNYSIIIKDQFATDTLKYTFN